MHESKKLQLAICKVFYSELRLLRTVVRGIRYNVPTKAGWNSATLTLTQTLCTTESTHCMLNGKLKHTFEGTEYNPSGSIEGGRRRKESKCHLRALVKTTAMDGERGKRRGTKWNKKGKCNVRRFLS